MIQGMTDIIVGNNKESSKAFEQFLASMYPFLQGAKKDSDKKLLEVMEQEIKKGPLIFSPVTMKTARNVLNQVSMPSMKSLGKLS